MCPKDGMKVTSLSGSQRSDDSFMSVGTKAVVGQQRMEIERLQAELAGRDRELEKLRAENLSLRSADRGSGEEPPVAAGTAATAPSDSSVLSKPAAARDLAVARSPVAHAASSPCQLATIAEPSGAPASAPAGSATATSERQDPKRAQSASSSRRNCVTHGVTAAGVKKPDAQASQGVRTEHVGKGVSAASGQLAQAAYTDYEALLDDAFSAIKEIIACCKMMQAHARPCTYPFPACPACLSVLYPSCLHLSDALSDAPSDAGARCRRERGPPRPRDGPVRHLPPRSDPSGAARDCALPVVSPQ